MRKKFLIMFAILAIVVLSSFSEQRNLGNFLATAENVNASTTAVNGTDFTSKEIKVSEPDHDSLGAIYITFTRAAGSSSTVDFEFQASTDGGTTWSSAYYLRIQIPTNETAISNVVVVVTEVQWHGISHLRLYRIKNNDSSNNVTACNANISVRVRD